MLRWSMHWLGLIFGAGETQPALQTVERLSGLTPGNEKMRFTEGFLLAENHQYAAAVKQFEAIPVGERDFAVCQNLGLAYSRLRQHEEAQRAFEQALRLDPSNPEPYLAIGLDLLDSRSPDQAVYPLTQAHQKAPQRVDVACALVEALIQTRQLVRAADLLAEVRARAPNDAAVIETAGDLYVEEGEEAKAQDSFRRVLQLDPQNLSARIALAKGYLRTGQPPRPRRSSRRRSGVTRPTPMRTRVWDALRFAPVRKMLLCGSFPQPSARIPMN